MHDTTREVLARQFEIAWSLLSYHLEGLETEECLWRPARSGLHVHRAPDGAWRADWPEHESYSLGPPSIAWLTWHIHFWWSITLDHHVGSGRLTREGVVWPGSAAAVKEVLADHRARWTAAVGADFRPPLHQARWPFRDRPFEDVIAWVNLELMKNAAEIGATRFLYAVRPTIEHP
jgi:hypothetical protein